LEIAIIRRKATMGIMWTEGSQSREDKEGQEALTKKKKQEERRTLVT
jgi:hypothetical protein